MTESDKNPDISDPNHGSSHLDPELRKLADRLDARASGLRVPSGIEDRVFKASVGHLPAPETLRMPGRSANVFGRLALAACALLAFAVAARMFMNGQMAPTSPERSAVVVAPSSTTLPGLDAMMVATEADTVLVTILEAGRNGEMPQVHGLEGIDPVGAAFAPILGTTGMGFDDYLAEIALIEVELREN